MFRWYRPKAVTKAVKSEVLAAIERIAANDPTYIDTYVPCAVRCFAKLVPSL